MDNTAKPVNIKFEDLPKEKLIEILNLYAKLMMVIDGFWYLGVMNRAGDKIALDSDIWAWQKEIRYELKRTTELFGIKGDDVWAMVRALEVGPWMRTVKYHIDLKSANHAVLTISECPTLAALEKEGLGREKNICQIVEPDAFAHYAAFFNSKIVITPLAVPPRKDKGAICCQWEFKLP